MDLKNAKVNIDLSEAAEMPNVGTKRKKFRTYDVVCGILVVLLGMLFFFVLSLAISTGSWLIAFVAATPYISIFSLFAITAGSRKMVNVMGLISLLPSFIFVFHMIHIGVILFAALCIMLASVRMRTALFNTVKIQPGQAMQSGVMLFLFGLSCVVSSQYYFTIRDQVTSDLIPRLDQSSNMNFVLARFFEKAMKNDDQVGAQEVMTVDTFLRNNLPQADMPQISADQAGQAINQMAESLGVDPALFAGTAQNALSEAAITTQDALLIESRKSLSEALQMELTGEESFIEVLVTFVNLKINQMISESEQLSTFLPLLLTLFVFLMIVSLLPLLRYLWVFIAYLLFLVLKVYGVVKIMYVKKNVEVIQL